ncbi:DDE-type integrase/transposase/recombinase, partial [Bacillus cereus]|uniref:DDE-type integrase/transposase/recombinase n=1 Tax=Bacillus cereus TaxID=1396 RepID=UPI0018F615B4
VDSEGNTIDFYLSKSRNHKAAKRFFKKALRSFHVSKPRIITVDKNPADLQDQSVQNQNIFINQLFGLTA